MGVCLVGFFSPQPPPPTPLLLANDHLFTNCHIDPCLCLPLRRLPPVFRTRCRRLSRRCGTSRSRSRRRPPPPRRRHTRSAAAPVRSRSRSRSRPSRSVAGPLSPWPRFAAAATTAATGHLLDWDWMEVDTWLRGDSPPATASSVTHALPSLGFPHTTRSTRAATCARSALRRWAPPTSA